jgi:drug/metabolite transporter (DMT)-like permease
VLAIVGSVLISIERRVDASSARPRTLLFAVIAGLCLGFATVALDAVPDDAGMVPVFLDTTLGLVLLLGLVGLARAMPAVRRFVSVLDAHEPNEPAPTHPAAAVASHLSTMPAPGSAMMTVDDAMLRSRARMLAAIAGLLIGGANVLLMVALHAGSVAVVAVLVNLYPVATVLMAWVLLRERVNAVQATGIVLAVTASVMLGLA